jgi:hypothetical protein
MPPFKMKKCKAFPLIGLKCSFVTRAVEQGYKPCERFTAPTRIKLRENIFQSAKSLQSLIK